MKRTAFLLLAVSSVLLVSAAFARTRPRQGGTVHAEMQADASQWMNSPVRMLVFDSLTRTDENGRVQPALAVRWESQSDDRRWQFWLRSGAHFHDGTPVSPATVVQALTAQPCGGCPWGAVRVAGDAVVFESENPVPEMPVLLANSRYAIWRKDESGNVVGSGPFRLGAVSNGVVTLNAVDDSWRPRPFVNAIELRGGRSLRDQWMDVGVGRADLVEVPAEWLRRAQQDHMRLLTSRDSELIALVVDPDVDPRLREALALSVDRTALFNVVFQKQGEVTASLLPNWLSGYSFAFDAAANVAKARELRAQVERPPELTLAGDANDPVLQLIADRVALNARDANIPMRTVAANARPMVRVVKIHLEATTPAAAFVEAAGLLSPGERAPADDIAAVFHDEQKLLEKRTIIPLLSMPRAASFSARIHDLALTPDGTLREANFWLEDAK